jgi:hypothetical protein
VLPALCIPAHVRACRGTPKCTCANAGTTRRISTRAPTPDIAVVSRGGLLRDGQCRRDHVQLSSWWLSWECAGRHGRLFLSLLRSLLLSLIDLAVMLVARIGGV